MVEKRDFKLATFYAQFFKHTALSLIVFGILLLLGFLVNGVFGDGFALNESKVAIAAIVTFLDAIGRLARMEARAQAVGKGEG